MIRLRTFLYKLISSYNHKKSLIEDFPSKTNFNGCGQCIGGCLAKKYQEQEKRKESFLKYPNFAGYMPFVCPFYEKMIFRNVSEERPDSESLDKKNGTIKWKASLKTYQEEIKELLERSSRFEINPNLFQKNR